MFLFGPAVLLLGGCRSDPVQDPEPELPAMREPAHFVPPADRVAFDDDWKPQVRLPERSALEAEREAAQAAAAAVRAAPIEPSEVGVAATTPGDTTGPKPVADPENEPATEGTRWALQASMLEPGCLMSGHVPALPLPSPEALAWVLAEQPEAFAGVAREALVCQLQLPRLTRAEVFGATAFRRLARSKRGRYAGGRGELGLVMAAIVTDQPRGEGTVAILMEARSEAWEVRATAWVPFEGDPYTRRLVGVRDAKLVARDRPTIVLRERDRARTVDHYLALSDSQELRHALTVPVAGRSPKLTARLRTRGRGWPRQARWEGVERPKDGPARWTLRHYAPSPDGPYVVESERSGALTLESAAELMASEQLLDAAWVLGKLPRKVRRSAAGLELNARLETARGRHKRALRAWRKAARAKGASLAVTLDYARYLVSRKRVRGAVKVLKRLIKKYRAPPESAQAEAAQVEAARALLSELQERRKR